MRYPACRIFWGWPDCITWLSVHGLSVYCEYSISWHADHHCFTLACQIMRGNTIGIWLSARRCSNSGLQLCVWQGSAILGRRQHFKCHQGMIACLFLLWGQSLPYSVHIGVVTATQGRYTFTWQSCMTALLSPAKLECNRPETPVFWFHCVCGAHCSSAIDVLSTWIHFHAEFENRTEVFFGYSDWLLILKWSKSFVSQNVHFRPSWLDTCMCLWQESRLPVSLDLYHFFLIHTFPTYSPRMH